jgi:hypothetical protein
MMDMPSKLLRLNWDILGFGKLYKDHLINAIKQRNHKPQPRRNVHANVNCAPAKQAYFV